MAHVHALVSCSYCDRSSCSFSEENQGDLCARLQLLCDSSARLQRACDSIAHPERAHDLSAHPQPHGYAAPPLAASEVKYETHGSRLPALHAIRGA